MAVGRPIKLTPNVARKTVSITATASQTTFTPTGGYRIGDLAVYRNGVRLVNGRDFTAVDGANVVLQQGATVGDVVEFGIFDSFNIADAVGRNGNQTIGGDLVIGSGTTLYSGSTGIVSTQELRATTLYGDGSNLTGIANTGFIDTADLTVSGIATFNGVLNADAEVTAAGGVDVTGGVKSAGIVTFTNTTASTSSSTGAVVITGGVGIGGSLHVGENVSVGGTLTYEDVTNIDSVGLITARTGVRVTAGGIIVTAGVSTFINDIVATATTAISVTAADESSDTSCNVLFSTAATGNVAPKTGTNLTFNSANGTLTATSFSGDGSNLSNLPASDASISTTTSTAAGIVSTLTLAKQDHKVTVSGISTFTCSGGSEGGSHTLRIINSGITTVGFSTYFLFPGGSSPSLPTADGSISLISFTVHRVGTPGIATQLLAGASVNFS